MTRWRATIGLLLTAGVLGLGGCAETELVTHAAKQLGNPSTQGAYKVGKPYQVFGVWYYPKEEPGYDQIGVASWYGPGFQGLETANGETFDMNELTAAHTTLPMPSYVRVTNLGNGRALVLRVNDRGPFARSRVIDVSRRAAQLLGFIGKGTAKVRVQAVAAPDGETDGADTVASAAGPVVESVVEPATFVALAAIAPAAGGLGIFVQAGAFADPLNAEATRIKIAHIGAAAISDAQSDVGRLYRVRLGPYASAEAAATALGRVWDVGLTGARLVTE